ncbi:MAG TPA: asparagine synthase-related protein [Aliidongia sp.]|nr:asparagine synthase-related protein [Aliidongia sp.]
MTAIAGIWGYGGRPALRDDCARMLASLRIYGPDATGQGQSTDLALGRNLMRTLPEDIFDRQPLTGGDGRFALVADIRLDNRDEVIDALGLDPGRSRLMADAEILLGALERWDADAVNHLIGEYAFAFWNKAERRLLLARDPMGGRPLHYHRGAGFFAFASMPKGLHALPDVPREADEETMAAFLALMPEADGRSFFRDVDRLSPGHLAIVTADGLRLERHWTPQVRRLSLADSREYGEALVEAVDRAVASRLRGAQDVAAHLSGGMDSSTVVASAARLQAQRGRKVVAFSSVPRQGYDGPDLGDRFGDEGPLAAETAKLYPNVEHVLVRTGDRTPLDGLDRGFLLYDRPILNACNHVWIDEINARAQQRKLQVMLTGDRGNATISYAGWELLPELLRTGRFLHLAKEIGAILQGGERRWQAVAAITLGPWLPTRLWRFLHRFARHEPRDPAEYTALHPDHLADESLRKLAAARDLDLHYRPWRDGRAMRIWQAMRIDTANYQKGMLAGRRIDLRSPFRDVRLLEFCLSIPTEQFLRNGVSRALLREAMADRLPAAVLAERRKGLQAVDWHEGLSAARDRLPGELDRLEACAPATRALDLARMRKLVEDWPSTGWNRSQRITTSYRLALLRGLSAGHFLSRVTGGNG